MLVTGIQLYASGYANLAHSPQSAFGKTVRQTSKKETILQELVRQGTASDPFFRKIVSELKRVCPTKMLRDLQRDNYHIVVKRYITDVANYKHPNMDMTLGANRATGLHSRGYLGNWLFFGEYVDVSPQGSPTAVWEKSKYWKNALIHETGHAIGTILGHRVAAKHPNWPTQKLQDLRWYGISEHSLFKKAWDRDVAKLPQRLLGKTDLMSDGKSVQDALVYYTVPAHPDDGGIGRTRQEAFAEACDIVLRGKESTYNYRLFRKYLPHTLQATRKILEHYYGPIDPISLTRPAKQNIPAKLRRRSDAVKPDGLGRSSLAL